MVSLWVGTAVSRAAFDGAVLAAFSDDGDFLGSPFSRGFGIGYYDDSLREAEYFAGGPHSLASLLAGSSHSDVTIPGFERLGPRTRSVDNCVVLLYDHRFAGKVASWGDAGVSLRFVAAVPYK